LTHIPAALFPMMHHSARAHTDMGSRWAGVLMYRWMRRAAVLGKVKEQSHSHSCVCWHEV